LSKPYPFYLAYALDVDFDDLGSPEEWSAERKWDGIRGQLILRGGEYYLWSRGEELVSEKFPELEILKSLTKSDVVIDEKHLTEVPVVIMAYDLLEYDAEDIRDKNLSERRAILSKVVDGIDSSKLILSEEVEFSTWEELATEREHSRVNKSEGIMLKHKLSPYKSGRVKGDWWKWKIDPLTIDAVMLYAQRGHGRRANLFTDFTQIRSISPISKD